MSDDRFEPRLRNPYFLAATGLARTLKQVLTSVLPGRSDLDVVDIGCGSQPHRPWIDGRCRQYLGIDYLPGPGVDRVGTAEQVPLPDGWADLVLSTQVLEHVDDPGRAVEEFRRLVKPEGCCVVSTHGLYIYHPHPHDRWRWTHEGLLKLFSDRGFSRCEVIATEGIASAIGQLTNYYLHESGGRAARFLPLRIFVPLVNLTAPRLDRWLGYLFPDHPLAINHVIVARP